MKINSLLLCLFVLLTSCGERGEREPVGMREDPGPDEEIVALEARVDEPNEDAPIASGALPYEFMVLEDFEEVEGCSFLLMPEENQNGYILGFDQLEGVAEGHFDGAKRTMQFVAKSGEDTETTRYTHANDEYESITRITGEVQKSPEVFGVTGKITIKRKSDGTSVSFDVVGERGC